MIPRQIKDLPLQYQQLFEELKAEKDVEDAVDFVTEPTSDDISDEYERLDSVIEEEDEQDEYDEYDENTYDMNSVSPYMREAFGELDDVDDEFDED